MKLEDLRIASPCNASWERMSGNDRVRFCDDCKKNVYNLSSMTREEAERLVSAKEGKLCALLYRRKDGTVLTSDCPVGKRTWRKRMLLRAACLVAILGAPLLSWFRTSTRVMGGIEPVPIMMGKVAIQTEAPVETEELKTLGYVGK